MKTEYEVGSKDDILYNGSIIASISDRMFVYEKVIDLAGLDRFPLVAEVQTSIR